MKKTILRYFGFLLIPTTIISSSLLISSCDKVYYSDKEDVLVITLHDKAADFANLGTFAICDSIGLISDDITEDILNNSQTDAVIENISDNFISRGFVKVLPSANPDFVVNVSSIKTLNIETYYPGYWYGYGGYYGGGYWGYPGYSYYYPWSYSYTYTTGTLLIEAIDLKNADANAQRLKVIWSCVLNGYCEVETNASLVNPYVNQGFDQSPYIQK